MFGRSQLALVAACALWALSFIASKVGLRSTPPFAVVTIRLIMSTACFLAWMAYRRRRFTFRGWRWFGEMVLLSLFGTSLHYGTQTVGLQWTQAANASLYSITGPLSITLIGFLVLGERLTPKKTAGILTAMVGVLVVMGIGTLAAAKFGNHLKGDLLVIASIAMWGIFTVYGKHLSMKADALEVVTIVTAIGAITMLPVGWIEAQRHGFTLAAVTAAGWGALAFLGVGCSFLATLLYFRALEKMESQKVGVYLYLIPPMTYLVSWAYLGETIGWNLLAGSLLVLGGVYLTERG
ncbi:MAG: DMT family transporter [Pseudomonadota bacterium]